MTHIIAVASCAITVILGALMVLDMIGYGKQAASSGCGCVFMVVTIVAIILWRAFL